MKSLFVLILFLFAGPWALADQHLDVSRFERLAIQDGGRIKPFDTYAREQVQLLTGSEKYNGNNPTELVLAWLFMPQEWANKQFLQIKHLQLKKDLGLPETQSYVSPLELIHNPKLETLFTEVGQLERQKKKLNPYYQAVRRISTQLAVYQEIISGQGLRIFPQVLSPDWISLADLQ